MVGSFTGKGDGEERGKPGRRAGGGGEEVLGLGRLGARPLWAR